MWASISEKVVPLYKRPKAKHINMPHLANAFSKPLSNLLDGRIKAESNMIRKRSHENSEKALPEQNVPIQIFKCDKCNFNAQQESLLKRHALCHVKVEVLESSKLTDRCTPEATAPKING